MDQSDRIVIIGGGVIGAFAAYYLEKKGFAVTLLEKNRFGSGASHGNCGLIVPDHILPLNSPGNLIKGSRWIFKKNAPLLLKPRIDPDLFRWLILFALNCRNKNIMVSTYGRAELLKGAIDLYRSLILEEKLAFDWEVKGALHAFRSQDEFEKFRSVDDLTARFGIKGKMLHRGDTLKMEPALGDDVVGAWFYNQSAHLRPEALFEEMRRLLAQRGVEVIEGAEVTGFNIKSRRAIAATTSKGAFQARQFVVATGAWTPRLFKSLGFRLPIQPGKGYSATMRRPANSPSIPCIFEETKVVATPWPQDLRLGGTMEFAGYDAMLTRHRLDALLVAAERYLKPATSNEIKEEWCGWRPMTPDGLPIIGQIPLYDNVIIAAGHNMEGISMGPGTGRLVAEIISNEKPHIDPAPYRITRFLS